MKKQRKKGEATTEQIVMWIILIASFAAILYFIFVLNIPKTSQAEICHNSVILRSSAILASKSFVSEIPLNCKTSYICLSKDGTCEKMTSPEIKRADKKEEVYSALAEEIANCWWMFGEGKADYIGGRYDSDLYCSICSQIAFDDSLYDLFYIGPGVAGAGDLKSQIGSNFLMNKEEFYDYLAQTNMPGKEVTYQNYFLGIEDSNLKSNLLKNTDYPFGYLNMEKQFFIITAEFSKNEGWQDIVQGAWKAILSLVSFPTNPYMSVKLVISTITSGNAYKNYMLGTIIEGESGHAHIIPTIIEANSEEYGKLNCGSVNTLS